MIVKIKKERDGFIMPTKGSDHAACYDVYVAEIEEVEPGFVICHLGFSTEIEKGYKAILAARSNITKYKWVLANGIGIIDEDYRNEWQARFRSVAPDRSVKTIIKKEMKDFLNDPKNYDIKDYDASFPYKVGERVAQMYFQKVDEPEFIIVDETSETNRDGGFGSTGLQ